MYAPKPYQIDQADALKLMAAHEFAAVIDLDDAQGRASHLPLTLHEAKGGGIQIFGHFSKANPQSKTVDEGGRVLAIFNGPHGYVSPTWYENGQNKVGTWNYQAVHITGKLRSLSAEDGRAFMGEFSGSYEDSWSLDSVPDQKQRRLLAGIVPFLLDIETINGVAKLSQNNTITEQQNISQKFAANGNAELAASMRQQIALAKPNLS